MNCIGDAKKPYFNCQTFVSGWVLALSLVALLK